MSTVRYYRWDDPGAPTLTGEVGSLTNLLRKCLVGTAGVAYGSKASAGWSEEFVGAASNRAVFRNNAAEGGCACYVHVHDSAPGSAGAKEASISVFASMSDIDTGTKSTGSLWFAKSGAASTAARKWLVVADGRTAWVYSYDNGGSGWGGDSSLAGFGDLDSKLPVESAHRYFCIGRLNQNQSPGYQGAWWCQMTNNDSFKVADPSGFGDPMSAYGVASHFISGRPIGGTDSQAMPDSETGDYLLQKFPPIFSGSKYIGMLRGIYAPMGNFSALADGALVPGSDRLVMVQGNTNNNDNPFFVAHLALDTVGDW